MAPTRLHSHTARSLTHHLLPVLQSHNPYSLTTDFSHLLQVLLLKLHLLRTRTPESIAPESMSPPQQLRDKGWITSLDIALQEDVAKLLRYQGAMGGDQVICERLVAELRAVRGKLAGSYGEGAFKGVDAVVEMVGKLGVEVDGERGERGERGRGS